MFPANAYRIWLAGADDADALTWREEQASQSPLVGRVLIGEIAGTPAAALPAYRGESIVVPPPAWFVDHDEDERLAA
jgi:hypothetical protein